MNPAHKLGGAWVRVASSAQAWIVVSWKIRAPGADSSAYNWKRITQAKL